MYVQETAQVAALLYEMQACRNDLRTTQHFKVIYVLRVCYSKLPIQGVECKWARELHSYLHPCWNILCIALYLHNICSRKSDMFISFNDRFCALTVTYVQVDVLNNKCIPQHYTRNASPFPKSFIYACFPTLHANI